MPLSEDEPPRRFPRDLDLLLALPIVLFALWCVLQSPDLTWFNTHMARDLRRAMEWTSLTPSTWGGPELNFGGGQLPGPALYLYTGLLWMVSDGIPQLLTWMHFITCLVLLRLTWVLRRDLGPFPAWVFFLSFFLMPVHASVSRTLWNPSLILPLDVGMLLCARAYFLAPQRTVYLVGYFFLGFLGLQVHFSTLPAFLAGLAVLWSTKLPRRPILIGAGLLGVYVMCFNALHQHGEFTQSMRFQYRLPEFSLSRLGDFLGRWYFHCHLDSHALNDYELFPIIFRAGRAFYPRDFRLIGQFEALGPVLVALAAVLVLLSFWHKPPQGQDVWHFYRQHCWWWLVLAIVPTYFYTAKGGVIPYRYGLMLYPVQFLLPVLALSRLQPRKGALALRVLALSIAALVFCGDAFYLLASYKVMACSGRASHVQPDTYEVPLRYKLELVRFGLANSQRQDPYDTLHGPIVNKIRLKDHDWDHTVYYGVLQASVGAVTPTGTGTHYWVQSFSVPEMWENARRPTPVSPFHIVPLEAADLPLDVTLTYLRPDGSTISNTSLRDGEMILPLNATFAETPAAVELKARLLPSQLTTLRICYDDSTRGTTMGLEKLEFDGAPVPFRPFSPGWLAQTGVAVPLPGPNPTAMRALFKVGMPLNRLTRIDIFKTARNEPFTPL